MTAIWIIGISTTKAVLLDQCQTKTLIMTAYYSPEQHQSFYVHGNYDSEIAMNGRGTHWASGTPVYDGMLAWPSTYPFGTLVVVPHMGQGLIQDRWWAIKSDNLNNTERIDIRVGKWTQWLMRALTFGRQTHTWYICSGQQDKNIWFQINKIPVYKHFFDVTVRGQSMSIGRKDQRVEILQKYLWKLWYIKQEDIHGHYNTVTQQAICQFQIKNKILTKEDPLCWLFGPKTSFAIKKEAQVRWLIPNDLYTLTTIEPIITHLSDTTPKNNPTNSQNTSTSSVPALITKNDNSKNTGTIINATTQKLKWVKHVFYRYYKPNEINSEIIFLQQFLSQNGYYTGKINGINSIATKEALYQFQLEYKLLTPQDHKNLRWYLWPKTRIFINSIKN